MTHTAHQTAIRDTVYKRLFVHWMGLLVTSDFVPIHATSIYNEEAHSFKSGPRMQSSAEAGSVPVSCYVLSVVFHSDDYVPLFVPFLDVPEGLSSLFQRIASINDRS